MNEVIKVPVELSVVKSDADEAVDKLYRAMRQMTPIEMPLTHRFTPGMYIRQIYMPKGSLVISKKHKTEHPFVVSQGRVRVWNYGDGVVELSAPFTGITKPETQRVLLVLEDCIWTTFHVTNETDPEKIVDEITEVREVSDNEAIDVDIIKHLTQEVPCQLHG